MKKTCQTYTKILLATLAISSLNSCKLQENIENKKVNPPNFEQSSEVELNQEDNIEAVELNEDEWIYKENKELGIQYSYPPDWKEKKDEASPKVMIYKINNEKPDDPDFINGNITISIIENPQNLTLQGHFDSFYQGCLDAERKSLAEGKTGDYGCSEYLEDTSKWKAISIDGRTALRSGVRHLDKATPIDHVYISFPGKFLQLSSTFYNYSYESDPKLEAIFEKFLKEFKILSKNKEITTPSSKDSQELGQKEEEIKNTEEILNPEEKEWVTEENNTFGIQYKYPEE